MAIATTAATASLIAAGVGLTATGVTTGMSFAQAGKQRKLELDARLKANEAMQSARKKLDINFYDKLGINKEPYELQRDALLSAGAEAIDAGVQSERGAGAVAGRVQMAQNEAQGNIRAAMSEDMSNLEKLSAQEDSRLRDIGIQLDLGEVEGAQLAQANAQTARAAANTQGFQGVTSMGQQIAAAVPLFGKNISAQKSAIGGMSMTTDEFKNFGNVLGKDGGLSKSMGAVGTGAFTNLDLGAVKSMTDTQYQQFIKELSSKQRNMLFRNEQYLANYNPF